MKRLSSILLIAAFLLLLAGCAASPAAAPEASHSEAPLGSPVQSAPPPEQSVEAAQFSKNADPLASASSAEQGIEIKDVEFDEAANNFFGGDAAQAIQKLSPMLLSAAQAHYTNKTDFFAQSEPDTAFEWALVYQYINTYAEKDKDIKIKSDYSAVVSEELLQKYFKSLFTGFKGPLPKLDTDYAIAYDKAAGTYTFERSDFAEVYFAVTGFSLSKANSAEDPTISATVTLTPSDGTVPILVEIVPDTVSMFGFSLQSVTLDEA